VLPEADCREAGKELLLGKLARIEADAPLAVWEVELCAQHAWELGCGPDETVSTAGSGHALDAQQQTSFHEQAT
jgi:hypothetical protein